MSSTLIAHADTEKVTREQLALAVVPLSTPTFQPVAHIELIETLEKELQTRGIAIDKEQFAMRADGAKLFGTFDLTLAGIDGSQAAIGFRNSNNKSLAITLVAGLRVFVCDNLALQGDMIALRRRHTSGLNLREEISDGLDKYFHHYDRLKTDVAYLQKQVISDTEAKAMIHDGILLGGFPTRLLPEVSHEYFNPRHADFTPRTAWSLHNAFTEVAKKMPLTSRMEAVAELGKYFGLTVTSQPAAPMLQAEIIG